MVDVKIRRKPKQFQNMWSASNMILAVDEQEMLVKW